MYFEFATATRIYFGTGSINQAGKIAAAFGNQVLLIAGRDIARANSLVENLQAAQLRVEVLTIAKEPTVELAQSGAELARANGSQVIIGFGGGSAIDLGKAVAVLVANEGEPLDYLEVIGRGKPLSKPSLPYIAIPTTAGTGAEVTANAVLSAPEQRVKVSLRSPSMLPKAALIDPSLAYDLPPHITAYTGMDALTQVLEPFVSNKANPLTDALCREGMYRAARSLRCAYENPQDASAREDMALAALFGGMALANAKLGAVHGFAAPIGGMFDAPHGAICAALLPHTTRVNIRVLSERDPHGEALKRYLEAFSILCGAAQTNADEGIEWLADLARSLKIKRLGEYGVSEHDIPAIAEKAAVASSMQGNPIKLTHEELIEILQSSL